MGGRGLTRTMVIWVPDWPVAAAAVATGRSPDEPIAVLDKGKVLATSAAARAEGVRRGQRARDAQSRCPELVVLKYDPVLDARAFDPVISCLEAITPGVQVIRPGMCALKARGPARFYGSEEAAAEKLLDRLETYDVQGSRIGIADGPFAAEQAARVSSARTRVHVVPRDGSPEFLAPLSVDVLEQPALTDLLRRLGLRSLGAFAQLSGTEVLTRFGPDGAFAHRLARGFDDRPVTGREIPPELTRTLDFEPAVDRVDQVAFAVRSIADELIARLTELGLVCTTLRVEVGTESGRVHEREWLHPRWFTAADVVDRVRWQLQGSGTATSELTSPVVRIRLVPDQADPFGAHVDGLWGGGPDERIHRALSRVQSMLGHGAVVSVVIGGGRGFAERQTLVPWGDPAVPARPPDQPWPGSITGPDPRRWPALAPTTIFPNPIPAKVFAADGTQISLTPRGELTATPTAFTLQPHPSLRDPQPPNTPTPSAPPTNPSARDPLPTHNPDPGAPATNPSARDPLPIHGPHSGVLPTDASGSGALPTSPPGGGLPPTDSSNGALSTNPSAPGPLPTHGSCNGVPPADASVRLRTDGSDSGALPTSPPGGGLPPTGSSDGALSISGSGRGVLSTNTSAPGPLPTPGSCDGVPPADASVRLRIGGSNSGALPTEASVRGLQPIDGSGDGMLPTNSSDGGQLLPTGPGADVPPTETSVRGPRSIGGSGFGRGVPATRGPGVQVADSNKIYPIIAWAGPWLTAERWWDPATESHQARFQFQTADTRAWLFTLHQNTWHAQATYD